MAKTPGAAQERSFDFRIPILVDTLEMCRDFVFTGSGLGTYASIYPFYSKRSLREEVALHPESDWLLLSSEAGLGASLLILAWLALLCRQLIKLKDSPGWPLRWAIATAVLTAVLHGFVDVPLHRPGLGWWVMVLAAIAFSANPAPQGARNSPITRRIFVPVGVLLFLMGAGFIHAQWFGGPPGPPFLAGAAQSRIVELSCQGKPADAETLARKTLATLPMARGLYFQLGVLLYSSGAPIADVESVFSAERALDPGRPQIPYRQGEIWRQSDPLRTAELWNESLTRHERISQAGGRPDRPVWKIYQEMLSQAANDPNLVSALRLGALRGPAYRLLWLAAPATPGGLIESAAKDHGFVTTLKADQRKQFLDIWWNKANRSELEIFLQNNPDWEQEAMPTGLRDMLAAKDYASAIRAAADRNKVNLDLPNPPATENPPPADSPDVAAVFSYYFYRGNQVTARRILNESASAGSPEAVRIQAALALKEGRLPEAWKYLGIYLQLVKQPGQQ